MVTPHSYEVVQRSSANGNYGPLQFTGAMGPVAAECLEVRFTPTGGSTATPWLRISTGPVAANTAFVLPLWTAQGSYTAEVRATAQGRSGTIVSRHHVGVGEVFITAGQSNSTFAGDTPTQTQTDRVSFFDGTEWTRCADNLPRIDPYAQAGNLGQPGNGRQGGSPWCLLGDLLFARWQVPIAFAPVGLSGTNVPKWAPATNPIAQDPPPWPSYAESLALDAGPNNVSVASAMIAGIAGFTNADLAIPGAPDGGWIIEDDAARCPGSHAGGGLPHTSCMRRGFLYARLVQRLKTFAPKGGVRAVLWHQGEGDACYQHSWANQVPANYYSDTLGLVIQGARAESGLSTPWLVAHVGATLSQPLGDGGSCPSPLDLAAIHAQQDRVVSLNPPAFVGPDTDTLGPSYRSTIVPPHFNAAGLVAHAGLWRDALGAAFPNP